MYTVNVFDCSGNSRTFTGAWAVQIDEKYVSIILSGSDVFLEKSPQFTITYIDKVINIIGVSIEPI